MPFRLSSPDLTCRWIIIILHQFSILDKIKLKQNGRLDGTCKFCWLSILTTSDQLKENLWIYHHQTFYMDMRWHKLGWYWFAAISEKQDGHHRQFSEIYCWTNSINAVQAIISRCDVQVIWRDVIWIIFRKIGFMKIYSLIHQHLFLLQYRGTAWNSLDDASMPHLEFTGWCLNTSFGIHWMLPQYIIWNSLDDASIHHLEFTGWCLNTSFGIHWMMPQYIIWNSLDDASIHHLEFTGWCLNTSFGIHWMMPQYIIWNSLDDASMHHQGVKG